MTFSKNKRLKTTLVLAATVLLITPAAAQAELGVGVGVSLGGSGGHGGVEAGAGLGIGHGGAGVGAGLGRGGHSGAGSGTAGGGSGALGIGVSSGLGTGGSGSGTPSTVIPSASDRATAQGEAPQAESFRISALVGVPVYSRDKVLVGMVERVAPGPEGKVDTVVRLNAALKTDKQTVRMRIAPKLNTSGALVLDYSKRQFRELFQG